LVALFLQGNRQDDLEKSKTTGSTEEGAMKLYDLSVVIIIVIVAAVAIGGAISSKYLGDDNMVEEISEEIVETQTGIEVDLSPKTPE